MATPQNNTRIALADRLEALRVATTPSTRPSDPIPASIFASSLMDNTTNVALQDYEGHIASPDELVIRQRGRRRPLMDWTPEQATNIRNPFQRTPTKMPLSTNMILRSSPRKRLSMGSTPPEPMMMNSNSSPHKLNAKQQLWPGSPSAAKKLRLGDEERPMAQINEEIPLATVLQGFSQQQLIDMIVGKVAGDAKAEAELRAKLPMPDIEKMEQDLLHAKRMIFKSLPTSRLCKKTDSTAFTRAALHLSEFKRLLTHHTKQLHDSGHWDALLDYIFMAWPCVKATPNWDNATHNAVRKQCFKVLTCGCMAAVKFGGLRLGTQRLQTLEKNLKEWSQDYEDVMSCVNTLSKAFTKGRTSL
ncbi:uncharacterized protein LOC101897643 [Musca domestica]|uniref:Uncharacterized protein LOC101897643 n=1 Tax=Musca domestica TaxID=7370 RepID=A0A9J7I408_MUSDO|nr:uncharacterized protein LOC101897643 [Musca domestica]